ncbi:hypothetical protein [Metamycoplasma phocicerebrale]|uniref:hypothetical protein n=1 Tax=Metamycoplasma phocicerebrale TaxID=142649 RepID=UPI00241128C2|nr:hypothetical protein [Metamycoplasma phocicerebrale]
MKLSNKKRLLIPSILSAIVAPVSIGLVAAKCQSNFDVVKTTGYADSMQKLANKSITVAGAWSDARFYAGEKAKDLIAVGATEFISNDGVQARQDLKKGDIEAMQQLLIKAVNEAAAQKKSNKEGNLTYIDSQGKIQSIFKIYNHDGYTPVGYDSEITYNIKGDKKKAYKNTPTGESEYIKYDSATKTFTKVGTKKIKIQFIPSSDASLV